MKLGNAAWGFRETSLEDQLRITSEMGISVLELGIGDKLPGYIDVDCSDEELDQVKALYKKYNIDLTCGAGGNDFTGKDEDACYKSLEGLKSIVKTAAKLGIEQLRIFAGFSPLDDVKGQRWDTMITCLNEIANFAKDYNMTLALETHGGVTKEGDLCKHFASTTTSKESLVKILENVPENITLNFDPANLYAVGMTDLAGFIETFRERISYVHLKEFAPVAGTDLIKPVACGEGPVDWQPVLAFLQNFDGPALIEYENTEDAEDGFKRSLEFLKANGI